MKTKKAIWMKSSTLVFALAMVFVFTASLVQAQDHVWQNNESDNDWNNPLNWSEGEVPPTDAGNPWVGMTGTNKVVVDSAGAETYRLRVGYDGDPGEVDIQGDFVVNHLMRIGEEADGTLNHTAGHVQASDIEITRGGGDGWWYTSGGTVDATGILVGQDWTALKGVLEISGNGEIYASNRLEVRGADQTATVPGELRVLGSDATLKVGAQSDGSTPGGYFQMGRADEATTTLLDIGIDAGGVSPIEVIGDIKLHGEPRLDVSFLDGSDRPGTWEILNWTGDVIDESTGDIQGGIGALDFADGVDTDLWSFDFDTNNSGSLSVTYIPEPSSLLLLGLAGLLLMKRRRV